MRGLFANYNPDGLKALLEGGRRGVGSTVNERLHRFLLRHIPSWMLGPTLHNMYMHWGVDFWNESQVNPGAQHRNRNVRCEALVKRSRTVIFVPSPTCLLRQTVKPPVVPIRKWMWTPESDDQLKFEIDRDRQRLNTPHGRTSTQTLASWISLNGTFTGGGGSRPTIREVQLRVKYLYFHPSSAESRDRKGVPSAVDAFTEDDGDTDMSPASLEGMELRDDFPAFEDLAGLQPDDGPVFPDTSLDFYVEDRSDAVVGAPDVDAQAAKRRRVEVDPGV